MRSGSMTRGIAKSVFDFVGKNLAQQIDRFELQISIFILEKWFGKKILILILGVFERLQCRVSIIWIITTD